MSLEMKITRTTPYSITIEHEGRTTRILGESFTRGYGSPDFIIDSQSIRSWEGGVDTSDRIINDVERRVIIDFVLSELRGRGWTIESE